MSCRHVRTCNMKLRQHQILTPKLFDKIVREEIERQFKVRYLKDIRLPDLYRQVPHKMLKDEVYSIFFMSFDDILENIGIKLPSRQYRNNLTGRKEKLKIRLYWYNTCQVIAPCNIVEDNFPDINKGENEDYPNIQYEIAREVFPFDAEIEEREGDIHLKFCSIYLYFHCNGKKYVIGLFDRISTIEDYVFTKHYFSPMLEMSRGLEQMTIEERTHGNIIELDMYNYTRTIGFNISSGLRSYERQVWQPKLRADPSNKNIIRIGTRWG
jgi:hypothetical protein